MLLTLPVEGGGIRVEQEAGNLFIAYDESGKEVGSGSTAEIASSNARNLLGAKDKQYRSSHFDQPNILAHVRFDERTDADGSKTLFIHEVQSDYGQEGKKKGFEAIVPKESAQKQYNDFAEQMYSKYGFDWMNQINSDEYSTEQKLDRQLQVSKGLKNPIGLPPAPFVTDTKAWVSLAIKRMMRYAAENGFDRVAFINGQQAADLYDLSKQVDQIKVTPYKSISTNEVAYRDLTVEFISGGSFPLSVDKSGVVTSGQGKGSQLEDVIGKEVAKKVMSASDKIVLKDVDLKVGGEGMRTFYDKIVPQVANDVLKKVGGGKVERGASDTNTAKFEKYKAELIEKYGSDYKKLASEQEFDRLNDFRLNRGQDLSNNITFTITPEMRDKIMGGLPLFRRDAQKGYAIDPAEAKKIIDDIQAKHPNLPKIKLVYSRDEMPIPQSVLDEINAQVSDKQKALNKAEKSGDVIDAIQAMSIRVNDVEGMYRNGEIWINANAITTTNRLKEVFAHEAIGHYSIEQMLNEVDRDLFPKLVKQVQNLNKIGNRYIQGVWNEVKASQPTLKDDVIAQEVLAFIAERSDQNKEFTPVVRTIWQKIIDGIKAFAKLVFDVDMTDQDVRDIVAQAERYAKGEVNKSDLVSVYAKGKSYFSLGDDSDIDFAREVLSELAAEDKFFRHKLSSSTNLETVMGEVYPTAEYLGDATREDERTESGADKRALFRNEQGKDFYVYEKGNEVWIDVSRFDEGDGGGSVYAAIGNYAHNANKVFVGDPAGLSEAAVVRRTKHMLGLALRFGKTDFIEPSPEQIKGDKEKGIAPLKWGVNNVDNVRNLIDTFISTTENQFPQLAGYSYDFGRNQFIDSRGRPVDRERFERGRNTPAARAARAGSPTARSFILTKSLIQSGIRQESTGILQAVLNGSNSLVTKGGLSGLFSRQGRLNPEWQSLDEESKMDDVIRYLQDKYVDLKRVTQSIKETAGNITDRWDAYLQEELYHGRTAKRVQDFINKDLKPLIDDMRMRGVGMADFEEYLWMRHAPERNAQIAEINEDMPDGGAGVTTAEAEAYMEALSPADKKKYEGLAKRIDAINKKSRQALIEYGLESPDTIAKWESAYDYYVPLMREDMERGTGNGTGTGFKVKGNSSKRALGSNRAVVDIIGNMAQQYEKNIIRGEKNRVATALIGLAKLNPKDDFWQVDTPPTIRHVSKATGLVEMRTDPNYKNRNNVIVARIPDKNGRIQERSVTFNEFNDRAMKLALSINNLDVDQVGRVTNFMGAITRYFSSINTQYNPIFGIINIMRDTQGAMLNLTTTELAGKQKEIMANIMPALRGIYADTRTESGVENPMQFAFTAKQKADAQAMRDLWEEYQREGGTTGFRDMYANAEERSKSIEKALDPEWWTKTLAGKVVSLGGKLTVPESVLKEKAIKPVFDWLSDYNQTLENAVRLAAYKSAIDAGITKQRAASIGKNLTVNFNRKGTITRQAGAWFAFFNAALQGTARIGETLTGPKGKQIIAGGVGIGIAQAVMLAAMGFDEDEPPEFVRANNFIIPAPNTEKGYVTIPMPLGFNVLPNFGRISTEWALSGAENTSERIIEMFGAVMESFNPLGGNGRIDSMVMPTAFDPFNDLSKNEDWTGRAISQEDFSGLRPTPGYTRTRDKTWGGYSEVARWINNLSGGDDFEQGAFSPTGDQIDYLVGQLTGGVGREVSKSFTTAEAIATGEDLPMYKIPLAGRFYGETTGQAPQSAKFYNNLTKINKIDYAVKKRYEAGEDFREYIKENPEFSLIQYGRKVESAIRKARELKRKLVEEGASRERVQQVDATITGYMQQFNDQMAKLKESSK